MIIDNIVKESISRHILDIECTLFKSGYIELFSGDIRGDIKRLESRLETLTEEACIMGPNTEALEEIESYIDQINEAIETLREYV